MSRIYVFLGPPGSGKGTQAEKLVAKLGIPHISLGDILRQEVRDQTAIGLKIEQIMTTGKLVPDEITIELTRQRIEQADCQAGFVLDGFPRSAVQADAFDQMKVDLNKVIYFDLTEDQVVERLGGRRSCRQCGAIYHLKYKAPKKAGVCDKCGGELYQRSDDIESAIRTRFQVYRQQTKPLVERYEQVNKLVSLDASGSIDDVFKRLLAVL